MNDHIHQEVRGLDLELGCMEISFAQCITRFLTIEKNQDGNQNLNCDEREAFLEEVREIFIRVLVFPLVLKGHGKEGGAVNVGVVLKPKLRSWWRLWCSIIQTHTWRSI
jgi:hypothetical protein